MDPATVSWLRSEEGQRALGLARTSYDENGGDPVRAATALRKALPGQPDHAAAALTQVRLRERAAAKFGADAERMYFTPDALEQATRRPVADHRAARLAGSSPGSVVDLGCGIGGDLIAFARAGLAATGVDLDPTRVALAGANLAALGPPGSAEVGDATAVDLSRHGAAFLDPARRSGRGREFRVADWTPPWEFAVGLLSGGGPAVVKVAPGIAHDLVPPGVEAEWVSDGGALKEAALWSPPLAGPARRATVLATGESASLTEADDPWLGQDRPVVALDRYVYEPDDAVIRAGLVTAVAALVGGGLLDARIAYVTAPAPLGTPFARAYELVEELPFRERQLKAALRARGLGRLTIKKRGVDVDPAALRRRLAVPGSTEGTLILTRVAGAGRALLVRPV